MSDGTELIKARVRFARLLRQKGKAGIKAVEVEYYEDDGVCLAYAVNDDGDAIVAVGFPFSSARWNRAGTPALLLRHFRETMTNGSC